MRARATDTRVPAPGSPLRDRGLATAARMRLVASDCLATQVPLVRNMSEDPYGAHVERRALEVG